MKVKVDRTKCSGVGLCEMTAPTVFQVGADGQSQAVNEEPTEDERAGVEKAVASCPTAALAIEE